MGIIKYPLFSYAVDIPATTNYANWSYSFNLNGIIHQRIGKGYGSPNTGGIQYIFYIKSSNTFVNYGIVPPSSNNYVGTLVANNISNDFTTSVTLDPKK